MNCGIPLGTWASDTRPLRTVLDPVEVAWPAAPRRGGGSPSRAWPSKTNRPNCLRRGRGARDWRRRRLGDAWGRRGILLPGFPRAAPGERENSVPASPGAAPHAPPVQRPSSAGRVGPCTHLLAFSIAPGGPRLRGSLWPRRGSGTKAFGGAEVQGQWGVFNVLQLLFSRRVHGSHGRCPEGSQVGPGQGEGGVRDTPREGGRGGRIDSR